MNRGEVVESVGQLASIWGRMIAHCPGLDRRDRPGIAVRWGDSPFAFWNALILDEERPGVDLLARRIGDAAATIRSSAREGFLFVCEEYLDDAARLALPGLIADAGLAFALPIAGMVGDILPVPAADHPALRFERVTTRTLLDAYADINSEGYNLPAAAGRAGMDNPALWIDEAFAYVGFAADRPVSAAATIVNDGLLYLALVATRPAAQRHGYAGATVRHALNEGHRATGLRRALLHATDAGFPVYARIGFRRTMRVLAYGRST